MKPRRDLTEEDIEELNKFKTWLIDYLCHVRTPCDDILVRRVHDYVNTLCNFERGFSEKIKGEKTVVELKPLQRKLTLITNEATK